MKIDIRAALLIVGTALLGVIVYIVGSDYLETRHQINTQRQEIQKSVAENTEGVSRLLKYDVEGASVTYGEIFERGEDRLKKISDASIPVGISKLPDDEKQAVKAYLEGLEVVLRLEVAKYRKELAATTSLDSFKDAAEDFKNSSYYGYDFAKRRFDKESEAAKKAIDEMGEADEDFLNKIKEFRKSVAVIRPALNGYDLVDDTILAKIIEKNKKAKK